MALYEIDTLKQSLKKYAVVLTVGLGVGIYLSNCAFKPSKLELESKLTQTQYVTDNKQQAQLPRELTHGEQRLKVFETYTRP